MRGAGWGRQGAGDRITRTDLYTTRYQCYSSAVTYFVENVERPVLIDDAAQARDYFNRSYLERRSKTSLNRIIFNILTSHFSLVLPICTELFG